MRWHLFFRFDGRIGLAAFWGTIGFLAFANWIAWRPVGDDLPPIALALVIVALIGATPVIVLAATVKRFHDRGRSGWWVLVAVIPVFGWIWTIVELGIRHGDDGTNRYGLPDDGSPFERGPGVWTLARSAYRGVQ